jgi:hypothetical protein
MSFNLRLAPKFNHSTLNNINYISFYTKIHIITRYKNLGIIESPDLETDFYAVPLQERVRFKEFKKYLAIHYNIDVATVTSQKINFYIKRGVFPPIIKEKEIENQGYYDSGHLYAYLIVELLKQIFSFDYIRRILEWFARFLLYRRVPSPTAPLRYARDQKPLLYRLRPCPSAQMLR